MSSVPPRIWRCGDRELVLDGRVKVMGILNVTPDSFSDGGQFTDVRAAVDAGRRMVDAGADVLDIGGESTRPGAQSVSLDEEMRRVLPVTEGLRHATDVPLSIDTRHAPVAAAALAAGADIVNDVSALTHDPDMATVAVSSRAGVVLMHMQGEPATMQEEPIYADVLADVAAFLEQRVTAARAAGLDADALVVDPGIGFGKTLEHNLALLRGLPTLAEMGYPLLVGLSRKRFLGAITGRETGERMAASLAAHIYAAQRGASILRVHDVMQTCDAMAILDKLGAGTQ